MVNEDLPNHRQVNLSDGAGSDHPGSNDSGAEAPDREELLESILSQTTDAADDENLFGVMVDHARRTEMDRQFGFETVVELVALVVTRKYADRFSLGYRQELVEWIANVIYDDPFSRVKTESLWDSIVRHLGHDAGAG